MNRFSLAVASVSLLTPSLTAAFDGPYAPELWTFTTEAGGFIDAHTADTLVLVGGDSLLSGDTDILVTVIADGLWTFSWSWESTDWSPGFDNGYYLINGAAHFLAGGGPGPYTDALSVQVHEGDVIGFRVETTDGIFGPGVLTITNFNAPVPGPPVFALILAALGSRYRRRRYDARDGG